MKEVDFLIIGQGIAGTLLAWFLEKEGKAVAVADAFSPHAASQVAAGIINPITGRRYVKSWRVDELIPFAVQAYAELSEVFGKPFFHEWPIIRTLFNRGEENDWLSRTGDPAYAPYMKEKAKLGEYALHTVLAYGYGEVLKGGQADLPGLTAAYREKLRAEGRLIEADVDYEALKVGTAGVAYEGWHAGQVVFAEGHRGAGNPFFNYLPYGGAKGEVLIVRIPGVQFSKILKHRVFIVPLPVPETYWVGATYGWKFDDEQPTASGGAFLRQRLEEVLSHPFEVLSHKAAVRPTVKDRRPFLGRHPEISRFVLFNGLGTKGASLGPFWAHHLAQHLCCGAPLDPEVDISRFG